jgi:hypothetical protein
MPTRLARHSTFLGDGRDALPLLNIAARANVPEERDLPHACRNQSPGSEGKRKMKLAQIFVARETWKAFAGLKMPPHTAYRLLKYVKRMDSEFELIESQRQKLIKELLEQKQARLTAEGIEIAEDDKNILKPADPEYMKFAGPEGFGGVLETESDLKPFSMTLSAMLDLAGKEAGNVLSAQDLGLLEPFFEEPKE